MAKRSKKKSEPIEVGTCFAMPQADGRFSACQVLAHHPPESHEVIALDWIGDAMPTLAELEGVSVLIANHHSWDEVPQRLIVDGEPPPEFVLVGARPPLAAFEDEARSYAAWEGLSERLVRQRWWDNEVPDKETRGYKEAKKNAREKVSFELGGHEHEGSRGASRVSIGPDATFAVDADASLEWSVLDVFGMVSTIEYTGTDLGVLDYFRSRVLLDELMWRGHGQASLDLSGTGIEKLILELGEGPLALHLPADMFALSLIGYRGQALTVHHPNKGKGLQLWIHDLTDATAVPAIAGLSELTALSLSSPSELSLANLGYAKLERLSIGLKAGRVHDLEALTAFPELERLRISECYAMEPERFPAPSAMPKLASVVFHTLRKTHATSLKKRLKGIENLKITGAKSDAWLAANADNPFNNWVDDSPKLAKAACKIYKQSYARVSKLDADAGELYHLEMVGFVQAFNRLGAKHNLDTLHREGIFDAFHELAQASPVAASKAELAAWFDEDREF